MLHNGRGTLKAKYLLLVAGLVIAVSGALAAQEATAPSGEQAVDESDLLIGEPAEQENQGTTGSPASLTFWDFARMALILGAVLGVVYLVFFLLKRAGGRSMQGTDLIRVLGAQSLPGNRAVYLVSVGRQVFLVGGADHAVTLISEIDDKETVDEILLNAQSREEGRPRSFGDVVAGFFANRTDSSGGGGRGVDEPLGFLRSQRERLKKL